MNAESLNSVATARSVNNPLHRPQYRHNVQPSQEPSHRQPPHRHLLRSHPNNAADPINVATRNSANNPQRPQHPQSRHNVQPSQEPLRRQPLSQHQPRHRHRLRSHPSNAADLNNAATRNSANKRP